MKCSNLSPQGIVKVVCIIAAATILITSCAGPVVAQPTPDRETWRNSIARTPLPKKGCFTATYPKIEWQEVPCGPASQYPNPPREGPRPNVVGNGNDISAQAPGLLISSAVGSFDSVTPNTVTETGLWSGNANSPNAFTQQPRRLSRLATIYLLPESMQRPLCIYGVLAH
jgi:hypothetical protein